MPFGRSGSRWCYSRSPGRNSSGYDIGRRGRKAGRSADYSFLLQGKISIRYKNFVDMTIEEVTGKFRESAEKMPTMGKALKFQFPEGIVYVDLTGEKAEVSNEDKEADTTIITTLETLDGLRKGTINPMMAVMSGKVKIKGDMALAMKLQSLMS